MVLAVPVQAADIPEISASYSVGLRVDSVFPDASALGALFFLGDAPACRAEAVIAAATHSAETAANADSAALPPPPASAKATAVVPPGDTLMLYFAVASRAARRAIFTMFAEVSLLTRPPPPGDAPAADGGRLELYHRRCMVGDAAMDRGRFFEARLAYDAAVAVDPGFAAAHVRLLRLTAAVGDPGPWGSGGGGGEGGMAVAQELAQRALFGMAREAAEAVRELVTPADSGRASAIRAVRDAGIRRLMEVTPRCASPTLSQPTPPSTSLPPSLSFPPSLPPSLPPSFLPSLPPSLSSPPPSL